MFQSMVKIDAKASARMTEIRLFMLLRLLVWVGISTVMCAVGVVFNTYKEIEIIWINEVIKGWATLIFRPSVIIEVACANENLIFLAGG